MDTLEMELKSEFNSLGMKIDDNQLSLSAAICKRNNISANDLVETWCAFALNCKSGNMILSEDNLLLMETKELLSSKASIKLNNASDVEIPFRIDLSSTTPGKNADNCFTSGYEMMEVTSPKVINQIVTPNKVARSDNNTTMSHFKFPPEIIKTFGVEVNEGDDESSVNIVSSVLPDIEKDCCMYSTIKDEASLLSEATIQLIDTIKTNCNFFEDNDNEDSGSYYSGRIIQTNDSKLNPSSIKLHNPELGDFNIDISQLNEFSVFPGQVIIVKGTRAGNKIIASHIYDNGRLPLANEEISIKGKIKLLVACGPFIESETDSLDSIEYIAKSVQHLKPHALIIIGPIINSKSFSSDSFHDFQSLYKKAIDCLSSLIDKNTKIYCVINKIDRCSIPVYPTLAPYDIENPDVHILPDPALISVNGVSIALSSSDVLLHIAQHEIRKNCGERFLQLSDHCLKQQSMYPLYPSDISVGMDYKLWERYAVFNHSPHFIFFRSAFTYFVKESEGKNVVINSGSMSSKKDAKTFALLELSNPNPNEWTPTKSCCVKILKA